MRIQDPAYMGNTTKPETPDSEPGREKEDKEADSARQAGSATQPGQSPQRAPATFACARVRDARPRVSLQVGPGPRLPAPPGPRGTNPRDERTRRGSPRPAAGSAGAVAAVGVPGAVPARSPPVWTLRPATASRGRRPCARLRTPCRPLQACTLGLSTIQAEAAGDRGHPGRLWPAGGGAIQEGFLEARSPEAETGTPSGRSLVLSLGPPFSFPKRIFSDQPCAAPLSPSRAALTATLSL